VTARSWKFKSSLRYLFTSFGCLPLILGGSDGAVFLPDVNREPNPLITEPTSCGPNRWLKIAGYVVLLLLVAWLYSLPSGGVKPVDQHELNKPSTSAEAESRDGRQATRDSRSQQRSARQGTPRTDDDGDNPPIADAPDSREGRDKSIVVRNVRVTNGDGRVIYRGDVDLSPTLDRINRGVRLRFSHDGIVFENREKRLPIEPAGYYHEFVHPTPDDSGPGGQRVVLGRKGEVYYSPDHYRTFRRVR
jgi:ribonuclease T1